MNPHGAGRITRPAPIHIHSCYVMPLKLQTFCYTKSQMKQRLSFGGLTNKVVKSYYKNPTVFTLRATILLLVASIFVLKRNFWTPDTLFLVLLAVFVAFGQARAFIVRFLPLVALLLAYESFRGVADDLNKNVHFFEMIHADRTMFNGALPTAVLQQWWWHGAVRWYDFYFYFLYTIHFVMPLLLALTVWKLQPKLYWTYMWALVGLSFAAFLTYIIFPAAPPWMANDLGYIEPIHRVSSDIWFAMGVENFSQVYAQFSPNPVAAVPSLHSAYPLLFVLFAAKLFSWRRTWWLMFYPISMWIGVVYLGEHYVIDAILGASYAVGAYFISLRMHEWHQHPVQKAKHTYRRAQGAWARLTS